MKRGALIAAVVLVGALGCARKQAEPTGETTTTSGIAGDQSGAAGAEYTKEPGAVGDHSGSPSIVGGGATGGEPNGSDLSTGTGKSSVGGGAGASADHPGSGDVAGEMTFRKDGGVSIGSDVGAGSDNKAKSGTGSDKAKSGAGATGSAAGDDPASGSGPTVGSGSKAKAGTGDNKSTTLGDGTSGQYTGGKGSYGGKATHGTGDKPSK